MNPRQSNQFNVSSVRYRCNEQSIAVRRVFECGGIASILAFFATEISVPASLWGFETTNLWLEIRILLGCRYNRLIFHDIEIEMRKRVCGAFRRSVDKLGSRLV